MKMLLLILGFVFFLGVQVYVFRETMKMRKRELKEDFEVSAFLIKGLLEGNKNQNLRVRGRLLEDFQVLKFLALFLSGIVFWSFAFVLMGELLFTDPILGGSPTGLALYVDGNVFLRETGVVVVTVLGIVLAVVHTLWLFFRAYRRVMSGYKLVWEGGKISLVKKWRGEMMWALDTKKAYNYYLAKVSRPSPPDSSFYIDVPIYVFEQEGEALAISGFEDLESGSIEVDLLELVDKKRFKKVYVIESLENERLEKWIGEFGV